MQYQDLVERSFEEMRDGLQKKKRSEVSGAQNVLQLFVDFPKKIWWWSWEVIGWVNSNSAYISHRGPARASDLAIQHPDLVECRKVGKYAMYRARMENSDAINAFLDEGKKKILGMEVVEDSTLPPNASYLVNP